LLVRAQQMMNQVLDPRRREDNTPVASEPVRDMENDDPGEPDFGVADGSSWDDDGPSADGDSGNDWTY